MLFFLLCRLFLIVQLLMGYVVYASFALQFYVPMDFLEAPLMDILGFKEDPHVGNHLSRGKKLLKTAVENTFRALVVTFLCELSTHTVSKQPLPLLIVTGVEKCFLKITYV